MISARVVARAAIVAAMALLAAGAAKAGDHAPWPTDWNNWNDPALWVTVGNPGNTGELSGAGTGGHGPDRICGAVGYTFKMGKYEVTAGQYCEFLNAVAATDTYGLYNTSMWSSYYGCKIERIDTGSAYTYSVAADRANRPVNNVSWGDAARFCNWLTKGQPTGAQGPLTTEDGSYYLNGATSDAALMAVTRKTLAQGGRYYIPTEDEWYKAAYHKNDGVTGNYLDYPTGTNAEPGKDMSELTNPGNNANCHVFPFTWPIDSGIYYTTIAGEFHLSDSPYGTFDQGGNVYEWNDAILDGSSRGLRGGSFADNVGELVAAWRYKTNPALNYDDFGFRISEVPEPATMALLALGGVGMLIRRRCMGR